MPKFRIKSKKKTNYLDLYHETRKYGDYGFKLDLRVIKDDSKITRSEKIMITKIAKDFEEVRPHLKTGNMLLVKPRRHRGESDKQYKKRYKKIQKNENSTFKHLNVIPVGIPKNSHYKIINNRIVTQKATADIRDFRYPLDDKLKEMFMEDSMKAVNSVLKLHKKLHPKTKPKAIGLCTNGYAWKLGGLQTIEELIEHFENLMARYAEADDTLNIATYVTHVIVRG